MCYRAHITDRDAAAVAARVVEGAEEALGTRLAELTLADDAPDGTEAEAQPQHDPHGSVREGTRRQQSWSCRPPPAATVGHSAAWTVVCPHFALVVPLVPMRLTSSSLLSGTASFWSTTCSGLYGWNGHSPIAATDTLPRLAAHSFS